MAAQKKVLVVEDEPTLGDILTAKLQQEGYDASVERDGEAGLKAMQELSPDLILLDIVMPKMDGYEVLEAMTKDPKLQAIPVIVISNSGQPVEIERILKLGVKDYIVKAQFTPEEVLAKVAKFVGGSGATTAPDPADQKKKAAIHILIVEDDPFLSSLAFVRLQKEGYSVESATDGQLALQSMEKTVPDLVLLDIVMPVMDGFEVLKRMRANEKLKDVPVIIFSNLGNEHEVEQGKMLGADEFFVKAKFTLREVLERIEALLKRRGKL